MPILVAHLYSVAQGIPALSQPGCIGHFDVCSALCCRFIKWTQDTFVTGGNKAELRTILEECTRQLHSFEKYKRDVRYLRIWIQYVSVPLLLRHAGATSTSWNDSLSKNKMQDTSFSNFLIGPISFQSA